jgi:hypothetical protein
MTDEVLVLAARSKARLGQALSATQHAESHVQGGGRLTTPLYAPLYSQKYLEKLSEKGSSNAPTVHLAGIRSTKSAKKELLGSP